jgi:hypothetical protein
MIKTSLQYLARDKIYDTEKPYRVEFDIEEEGNVKSTNHKFATEPVVIHAIQASDRFELDKHGFCVLNEKTELDVHAALTTPDLVETAYIKMIEAIIYRKFPEYTRIEPLEFVVRRIVFDIIMYNSRDRHCRSGNAMSDSHQILK